MKVIVTARHCAIDDELRKRAVDLIERAAKRVSRPQRAEIVFDNDHNQKVVEFQLYLPRGSVHIASAEAADFRTALDRTADKLRNQLDKLPSLKDRRATVPEK